MRNLFLCHATLTITYAAGYAENLGIVVSSAYIPSSLEVPAFVPPAPVVPKTVPEMRVDAAVTVPARASKTLTLLRGEASTLPDIPPPPVPEPIQQRAVTTDDLARNAYNRCHTLQFGAMVYDHCVSVVHWKHPDNGESYEAICGFDIGLLENIGSFIHDGEAFTVMMMHTPVNTSAIRRFARVPVVPEVPANAIVFLKGNADDPTGTAPITLIKKLLAAEKPRLTAYQAARKEQDAARIAWEISHPTPARDETVWLRPHRGSRYLADPRPEAAAR